MKKTLPAALISLFFVFTISAQSANPARKPGMSIYMEAGGPGVISFNYDTRFTATDQGLGGRIGIGGYKTDNTGIVYVPVGLTYLLSKNDRDYIELGAGFTYVDYTRDNNDVATFLLFTKSFGHLNFGYRYQQKGGGLVLRVAINPVFGNGFFYPAYGGLAIGYKF